MNNHHPSIRTEDVLQYKHRSLLCHGPHLFWELHQNCWWFMLQAWWLCHSLLFCPRMKNWDGTIIGEVLSNHSWKLRDWHEGWLDVLVPRREECWLFQFALDSLLFLLIYFTDLKLSMTVEAKFRQALLSGKYILVRYHFLSQLVPHILSWFHHSSVLTAPHRSEIICLI